MSDSIDPYRSPAAGDTPPAASTTASAQGGYRPWSRGRTYMIFIFGMHAAGFMMIFFHPVMPIFGVIFGIPALVMAGREIREIPDSAAHAFVRWGRLGGKIGVIGGAVATLVWIIVGIAIAAS